MQFGIKGKHQQSHASKATVDGGKAAFQYGSSTTGKTDQETQSPVLKIFTDMLAREKSFQGYRDPEKAALLRAEHKRERDIKRDERRGDDRKDDGKRDDSDEHRRRSTKKNKKPRNAKKRSTSNPKTKEKKEKKKLKPKISCHCPKSPKQPLLCDDAYCQVDGDYQSSSKEDVVLTDKMETRVTTTAREQEVDDDDDRIYEQRERVRERNFKRKMDDTCSCASCVLKKMCRSDCICYCCVAFVFILCLFLAFVLVCKSIPCLRSKMTLFGTPDELEGDRLKRKIDVPADLQWDGLDKKRERISNKWEYDRLPGHPVPNSIDSTSYGDLNLSQESELSKIIDSDKLSEIQSNERLREFYKKLVSTDTEIRKLKKEYLFNVETTNSLPYPDRAKRSLDVLKNPFKMFHPKRKKTKETTTQATGAAKAKDPNKKKQESKANTKETKDARIKRFDTNEDGLLIEKKKVSIKFVPHGRRTFKCSHAPKEINSYEKQVKNPFYQNTQRLDELLDKFLDKNVMDMMGEPYSRAMIAMNKCKHKYKDSEQRNETTIRTEDERGDFEVNFNDAKNKMLKNSFRKTTKHYNNNNNYNNKYNNNNNNRNIQSLPVDDTFKSLDDQIAKSKLMADHYNKNNQQADTDALQEFLNSHGGLAKAEITTPKESAVNNKEFALKKGNTETATLNYNNDHLLMSISTMMYKHNDNPSPAKKLDDSHGMSDRTPVGRRLMQIEMDDDEVVSVMPASKREGERRKPRNDETNPNILVNPNWKGPMPLYPDELNSVNKPGPVIVTTEQNPETESILFSGAKNRKLYKFNRGKANNEDLEYLTDMEYIEDYFRNKYDNVAAMAQAYSDYGVLNDKNLKNQRVDQRFRSYGKVTTKTIKKPQVKPVGVEKPLASTSQTEGFRLDIIPTSSHLDGVFKAMRKHIKFTGGSEPEKLSATNTPLEPFSTTDSFETTKSEVLDVKNIMKLEKPSNMESEFRSIKKRSLKGIDYYQNEDPGDAIESLMNFRGIFNGLQKKFSTKLGSAQDYAIKVASDYIHDGIYKRDVDSVDVDVVNDSIADDNITVSENITENNNISGIYNITDAMKLVTNDTDTSTAQTIETGVKIATSDDHNDTGTSLSDFFMKLSHWFSLLDTLELSVNRSQQENFSATNDTTEKAKNQPKFDLSFPLYDADMIENIGHRSRVLLAINETETVDESTPDGVGKGVGDTKDVGIVRTEIGNTTTTNLETIDDKDKETKTIVKRNADRNLFWDDVYNDDYGVDADSLDGNGGSKHVQSSGSKPKEKKHHPKDWFKKIVAKFKEGAAKLEHKHGSRDKEGSRSHRKCGQSNEGEPMPKKPNSKQDIGVVTSRRFYRKAESDNPADEKKTDFTALTAKMKKICQKAAKDISLSKKLEVREESKEGQVASKLMQQLIGLMSDLVDYQVHEKTCRKLPVDLQNFLEWLTNPESTVMTYHGKDTILAQNNKEPVEDIHTLEAVPPDEVKPEPKADYMSAMSSVRDLLNRYDSLSEDDKSKMSGVKEYLEAQMEYLQKQLYMTNDFNMFNTDTSRYKRNVKVLDPPRHHLDKVNSVYVTFRKYMRKQNKSGNNPTKNLYASDKGSTTSKVMTIAVGIGEKAPAKSKSAKSKKDKAIKKITKRNLKDVYYRALEEAKLVTSATVEAALTTDPSPKITDF